MSTHTEQPLAPLLAPKYWLIWFGLGLLRLLTLLPFKWQLRLGAAIGRLAGKVIPSRRRVIAINIRHCLPELSEAEVQKLVTQHLESVGISILETGLSWWAGEPRLTALVDQFNGLENLEKAQKDGQGVIILTAHFTQMELGGRLLAMHVDFAPVYRELNNPVIEYVNFKAHSKNAAEAIPKDNIKRVITLLRDGKAVWLAPDQQHQGRHSALVNFFGQPAHSATVTSTIARMGKAAVVPVFFGRTERGYCVDILPALADFPSGDEVADTEQYHHLIEEQVRQYPDQYLWVHKRFKGVEGFSYD